MSSEATDVQEASPKFGFTAAKPAVPAGYKQTEVGMIPEDWEVDSLRGLGSFKNGINKSSEDFGHGFPFVNLMDVFGIQSLSKSQDKLELINTTKSERDLYSLIKGDVLFVRSSVKPSGVGLTTFIPAFLPETVYSGFLIRFRDSGTLDNEFKKHCFYEKAFRRRLIAASTVSANTNINQNALGGLLIALPTSLKEQRAIATALSDVDALLEELDHLIAKKRDIKQATMQQLLTGQTRLPGFEGEWESKRLGELGSTYGGLTGKKKSDFGSGAGQYVTFTNVMENVIINVSKFERVHIGSAELQNRVLSGDLLFNGSSETPEEVAMCSLMTEEHEALFLNSFCFGFRLRNNKEAVPLFLAYYMRSQEGRNLITELAQGSTRYNVSKRALLKATVRLPWINEQTAIVTVLSDIDADIKALEQRRAKTAAIKQAMMQELLTGRTRLVNSGV